MVKVKRIATGLNFEQEIFRKLRSEWEINI